MLARDPFGSCGFKSHPRRVKKSIYTLIYNEAMERVLKGKDATEFGSLKVSLVWNSPFPEKIVSVAMRRCYSTKPIEEIDAELDQKGIEYMKYLLKRALEDKALDVFEHFRMEFLIENLDETTVNSVLISYPFAHWLRLSGLEWLLAINARTLIEMWRDKETKPFASKLVEVLKEKHVCDAFNQVVFNE